MKIDNFKYIPREEFTQELDLNTSDKCIGVLLYKVGTTDYWIEFYPNGFVVDLIKFCTLEDAYQALCIFIAENI